MVYLLGVVMACHEKKVMFSSGGILPQSDSVFNSLLCVIKFAGLVGLFVWCWWRV